MMKRLLVFSSMLVIGIALSAPTGSAKSYKNKTIAVIGFNFYLHPQIRGKMIPYEGLFPMLPEKLQREGCDAVYGRLKAYSYDSFKRQAERQLGVLFMPLNAYGKLYTYDKYGFPDTNIEIAQRRGDARYYVRIDMDVLASPESGINLVNKPKLETELKPKDYLRPQIRMTVTFFRKLGIIPYAIYESDVQWETPIILEPTMLDGLVNRQPRNDRTTLREVLDLGISGVVDAIKHNMEI